MIQTRLMLAALLCSFSTVALAQSKQVRTGNQLYQEKKYKEAASAYQQALSKHPQYTPGMFNLGNALYQQKSFDASRQILSATAKQTADKNVKANANYNIGNTYLSEQKWQDAINAYKAALRDNPQDEAAKYNLSYALAMMKKDQNKNDKQQQDKNKDNKEQDKQQNKDQNKDEQNKDQQDQQQQNKDEQKDKQDQQDQQDQRPQSQPSKLSEEQAEQLLNALAQEEKKLHDKKEKGKAVHVKVDKDW